MSPTDHCPWGKGIVLNTIKSLGDTEAEFILLVSLDRNLTSGHRIMSNWLDLPQSTSSCFAVARSPSNSILQRNNIGPTTSVHLGHTIPSSGTRQANCPKTLFHNRFWSSESLELIQVKTKESRAQRLPFLGQKPRYDAVLKQLMLDADGKHFPVEPFTGVSGLNEMFSAHFPPDASNTARSWCRISACARCEKKLSLNKGTSVGSKKDSGMKCDSCFPIVSPEANKRIEATSVFSA